MHEPTPKSIWWLPTFGFFLVLAIELWMFSGSPRIFQDPGVGRHLRTAEAILESGRIPHADPLSFTHGGEPWFDFEWAFEATIGQLYQWAGLGLIEAFCYAMLAVTILGIYRTLLQSGFILSVVLLVTGMTYLTLQLHFSMRPVLFTYLFMALVVEVWTRQARPRRREWIFLPIIFIAWANIHAGWLAALIFLVASLYGRLLDRAFGGIEAKSAPLLPWIGLTLLCGLVTCINPWGWGLYKHIVLLATTYKSFALWDEYLPPNFGTLSLSAITVLFIVLTVFIARVFQSAPKWRWEWLGPIIFFLYQGLKAQRHVILLMEVALVTVGRDLHAILTSPWPAAIRTRYPLLVEIGEIIAIRAQEFQARQRIGGADAWLSIVVILAFSWLFVRTPIAQEITVGQSVSPELVAFLRDHPDRFHHPLTTTSNAGPLLWNMRPDFRVSFDDRGDFYGDDTVFDNVNLTSGIANRKFNWRDKLAEGNYDSMLLDPWMQLNQVIHFLPEWKEVYRDKQVVVYWKDEAEKPLGKAP